MQRFDESAVVMFMHDHRRLFKQYFARQMRLAPLKLLSDCGLHQLRAELENVRAVFTLLTSDHGCE